MIFAQTYKNFEHFVYKDLNYKDAHDALYNEFMSKANEFDIMIKVDADMVIRDKTFFEWVIGQFKQDEELDLLTMALHDFYTEEIIFGMHAYRNTVKWNTGNEIVYTDRMHNKDTIRKRTVIYEPVAEHCKNPSELQAFHFGFHRALKAIQPGRVFNARLDGSWNVIEKIHKHFARNRDTRLMYSLAAAEFVFAGYYNEDNISYNDAIDNLYNNFREASSDKINEYIRNKKLKRFGFLPSKLAYRYIFYFFRIKSQIYKDRFNEFPENGQVF
jgi:hypothetical protein